MPSRVRSDAHLGVGSTVGFVPDGGKTTTINFEVPLVTALCKAERGAMRAVPAVNRNVGGSGKYEFDPSDFSFAVGESVTFCVRAETEFHTFTVDELGMDEAVDGGETISLTFTFDHSGESRLFCIPDESLGMVGTITVR